MVGRLDTRQRNNLAVGNALAAEIAATVPGRRAFVIVWPYRVDPRAREAARVLAGLTRRGTFSKILNTDREEMGDVRYGCDVIEVEEAALAAYLEIASVSDSARLERRALARRIGLNDLEELEAELCRHVDDLATLDVAWRVVPWAW